jgi:hypothetical protein
MIQLSALNTIVRTIVVAVIEVVIAKAIKRAGGSS